MTVVSLEGVVRVLVSAGFGVVETVTESYTAVRVPDCLCLLRTSPAGSRQKLTHSLPGVENWAGALV